MKNRVNRKMRKKVFAVFAIIISAASICISSDYPDLLPKENNRRKYFGQEEPLSAPIPKGRIEYKEDVQTDVNEDNTNVSTLKKDNVIQENVKQDKPAEKKKKVENFKKADNVKKQDKLKNDNQKKVAAEKENIQEQKNKQSFEQRTYTVWLWQETGDCLWNLANKYYGDPWLWKKIYIANKDKIKDPRVIYPKQVLIIPPLDESGTQKP